MGKLFGLAIVLGLFSAGSTQRISGSVSRPEPVYEPVPSEPPCWTKWMDRDNPSGTGDYETLRQLLEDFPDEVCPNPLEVEAKTLTGKTAEAAGDTVVMNINEGFYCKRSSQKDRRCHDYQVRFRCPPKFCKPTEPVPSVPHCWTKWVNGDDPSGQGDYETLTKLMKDFPDDVCPNPVDVEAVTLVGDTPEAAGDTVVMNVNIGFHCKNNDQKDGKCNDYKVRFSCPPKFCEHRVCWSRWMDRDNPSGTGDWETLDDLRKQYPNQICANPQQIEVVTTDGEQAALSTGQQSLFTIFNPNEGFVCQNSKTQHCLDYKVRIGCCCNDQRRRLRQWNG